MFSASFFLDRVRLKLFHEGKRVMKFKFRFCNDDWEFSLKVRVRNDVEQDAQSMVPRERLQYSSFLHNLTSIHVRAKFTQAFNGKTI